MTSSSSHLSRLASGTAVAALLVTAAACTRGGTPTPTTTRPTSPPPTGTPTPTTAKPPSGGTPDVAPSGARYRTVQEAVDAAPAGQARTITVAPGTYRGSVRIPSSKSGLTITGSTGRATDVVLTGNRNAESAGSNENSSTVVNAAANTTLANLTIANTFDRNSTPSNQDQALALTAKGDRQLYRNVRLLGHQDTLMTLAPNNSSRNRQLFLDCYVEGDVDFIFGSGTAVFDGCEIHSLSRSGGTIMAPSTYNTNPYGFLFVKSRFTSNGSAGSIYFGRPWHPNSDRNADGQATIRESTIGAHIKTSQPWTDMSGFSWRTEGRFSEYKNTGPGAGVNGNRPQLSDAQAGNYTRDKYLGGWNPS